MVHENRSYGLLRLKSKDARSAIVQKLAVDFNLMPIIAEAFYQQFALYFEEHANVSLSSGEVAYEAVASDEPAGRPCTDKTCIYTNYSLYLDVYL